MTGNNPSLSMELARRSVRCRLDPGVDEPWTRKGFKHADIKEWTKGKRADLVAAALTLIQAWIVRGRPERHEDPLGSFEAWSRVMGGILQVAGIPGFLTNLDELYEETDGEGGAWRELVEYWWEELGDAPQTVGTLNELCERHGLLEDVRGPGTEKSQQSALGKELVRQRDRVFGGYRIVQGRKGKGRTYSLKEVPSDPDSGDEEGAESSEGTSAEKRSRAGAPTISANSASDVAEGEERTGKRSPRRTRGKAKGYGRSRERRERRERFSPRRAAGESREGESAPSDGAEAGSTPAPRKRRERRVAKKKADAK